jgi:hypothetical protein
MRFGISQEAQETLPHLRECADYTPSGTPRRACTILSMGDLKRLIDDTEQLAKALRR